MKLITSQALHASPAPPASAGELLTEWQFEAIACAACAVITARVIGEKRSQVASPCKV